MFARSTTTGSITKVNFNTKNAPANRALFKNN